MRFIAEHSNIPVPKLHCCFKDDEAVYLIMEYIEGVGMNKLEVHLDVTKELKSNLVAHASLNNHDRHLK